MAARHGWTASTTRDDVAGSARNGSRDDGLVQARGHAARGADGRREAMFAVQRTDRLAMGRRRWLMRRPLELRDAVAMTNPTHAPKACRQVPAALG
jgi:hypothetical protein